MESLNKTQKTLRDASGRFKKGPSQGQSKDPLGLPEGPSQGHPKGPSQDHPDEGASTTEASRAASAVGLYSRADGLSDADSEMSLETDTGSTMTDAGQSRKRAFLKEAGSGSSDAAKSRPKRKPKARKRPPAIAGTHNVGLEDAQRQLNLAQRAQLQQDLEEQVAAKEQRARVSRAKSGYGASRVIYSDFSLGELERMAQEDAEEIAGLASKSSNLKGTFQKSLKCRAASMRGIIQELVQRTATDETRQLQAKLDHLQSEVSQLHKKLSEVTARPSQADQRPAAEAAARPSKANPRPAAGTSARPSQAETRSAAEGPSSNLEDIIRKVIMEERAFTRACFEGIEDRLLPEKRLRPPLAADKRPGKPGPSSQREDAQLPATTPSNSWTEVVSKGKGKAKKKARMAAASAAPDATPSGPSQGTGKGKGKGKGRKSAPAAAAPAAKRAPAGGKKPLVPPKTAAVVVTLTAEAAERGETYESVLTRARPNADPTQLGIGAVTCRRTQTGARIFEFPGAQGGANADLFANKLREVIADAAKVVRPVRSAALEVTDLDDSVTKAEVVAAIAAIGGCDVTAVQGRDIRPGRGGMGAIRLECPVTAAKAVLAKGRLPVGLSSCRVRALEDQPLRCFKCFGIGHTRALCPSKVDRADTCYRCGKEGHKSASCKVPTPRCAVCAASGLPAGHIMKGRNCNPPLKKGKVQAPTPPAAATAAPEEGTSAADEGGAMDD